MLNDFERRSNDDINYYDAMCNRFIIGLANAILMTHTVSHRANSAKHKTIVK
jgi:hypothetical protein